MNPKLQVSVLCLSLNKHCIPNIAITPQYTETQLNIFDSKFLNSKPLKLASRAVRRYYFVVVPVASFTQQVRNEKL